MTAGGVRNRTDLALTHNERMQLLPAEPRELLEGEPTDVQLAYFRWFDTRANRRASHRDTVEPFLAGYKATFREIRRSEGRRRNGRRAG